jgi:hypothetical protein
MAWVSSENSANSARLWPVDAEGEVGDSLGVNQTRPLKRECGRVHAAEQAGSGTEHEVHEVKPQLAEETGAEALLDDRRATEDDDVAVARGHAGLRDAGLEAAGHECVGRAALLRDHGLRAMSDHEDRPMKGRVLAPRLLAEVEHATANHHRARAPEEIIEDLAAVLGLAAIVEHPLMERLATVPHPLSMPTFGPVLNPSRDIEWSANTLPIETSLPPLRRTRTAEIDDGGLRIDPTVYSHLPGSVGGS